MTYYRDGKRVISAAEHVGRKQLLKDLKSIKSSICNAFQLAVVVGIWIFGKCREFPSFPLPTSWEDPWDIGKGTKAGSHIVSGSDPAPQHLEEGSARGGGRTNLSACSRLLPTCPPPSQAHGAGWDRGLLLLKPSDGEGADALHLSPSAHQKCCEETAQLRAKEHIC